MSNKYLILRNKSGLRYARLFLFAQFMVSLSFMMFFCMFGAKAAYSAFLGGCVSALPNVFFAYKLFADQRVAASKQIVWRFYQGEAMKLILSALLFSVIFLYVPVTAGVFFMVYIVTQMMGWIFPLLLLNFKISD